MKAVKTVKKTKKPAFIVDLTNAETAADVKAQVVRAKALAGVKVSNEEIDFLINYGAELALDTIDSCIDRFCEVNKPVVITDKKLVTEIADFITDKIQPKKPWYKRFWGWLTKPFKKNK